MHLSYKSPEAQNIEAILLDGVDIMLNGVIELDTENGWAKIYKRNKEGILFIETAGNIATETIYGDIKIIMKEDI